MTRKDQFRTNLHEAAKRVDVSKEQLAGELDLDPLELTSNLSERERQTLLAQQRKWLYRMWDMGVDRENKNTVELLQWLAKRLHLHHYKMMWSSSSVFYSSGYHNVVVDLEQILNSPDGGTLRPAIERQIKVWQLVIYIAAKLDGLPDVSELVNAAFERTELLIAIREILRKTDVTQPNNVVLQNILPQLPALREAAEKRIKENPMLVIEYKERQREKLRFEIELARATTTKPKPKTEPTKKLDLYQRLEQEYPAAFSIAVERIGPEALKGMIDKSVKGGVHADRVLEFISEQFSED